MNQKCFFPILGVALIIILFVAPQLDENTLRFAYSVSLLMRSLLQFVCPFLIISIMGKQILEASDMFWKALGLLFPLVFVCNFFLMNVPYFLVSYFFSGVIPIPFSSEPLLPIFTFTFHPTFTVLHALYGCVVLALFSPFLKRYFSPLHNFMSQVFQAGCSFFMGIIYYFIMPGLLIGSVIKLQADHLMETLCSHGLYFYLQSLQYAFVWIILLWLVATNFSFQKIFTIFEKLGKVVSIAFISMSSLLTLPFLLDVIKPYLKRPKLASITLPILSNIHSVGCAIITGCTILLLFKLFNKPYPPFENYICFAFMFTCVKFTNVALPGAAVILMLPLLEKYLGFTVEMSYLLLIIDLLTDSIVTVLNVLGNGAMVMIVDSIYDVIEKKEDRPVM
jgi:Na+/H+-dicarboxylate symporter